ncbi:WD40-repeat-containing domain protein [Cyathus striatus]|nr:WD40-repeat-containing domain protein [Cyathus striatus]
MFAPDSAQVHAYDDDDDSSAYDEGFNHMPHIVLQVSKVSRHSTVPYGRPDKRLKPMGHVMLSRTGTVTAIRSKFIELESVQDIGVHQALVRNLQFSPDGKYLATSSWDRTSAIYFVKILLFREEMNMDHLFLCIVFWDTHLASSAKSHGRLWGILVDQAPSCNKTLVINGVCEKIMNRPQGVEAIAWFPDGDSSFLLSGRKLGCASGYCGTVKAEFDFGHIKLFSVAVTPDGKWLFVVGTHMESPTGLQPKKSRTQKQFAVCNITTGHIEIQTPVFNDVCDITLERGLRPNEFIVLVSYKNRVPPQLWKLDFVKESSKMVARLIPRHTYTPKISIDFACPSCFGGKNQEFVLSAGKSGDIHIWDTESGALLHHIRGQLHAELIEQTTAFAWNHASEDPFMFATGSLDGGLRIWTKPDPDKDEFDMELTPIAMQAPRGRSRASSFVHTTRPDTPSRPGDNRNTICYATPSGRPRGRSVNANAQPPVVSQLKERLALISAKAREAQANQNKTVVSDMDPGSILIF